MSELIEKLRLIASGDTDYTLYPDEAKTLLAEVERLTTALAAEGVKRITAEAEVMQLRKERDLLETQLQTFVDGINKLAEEVASALSKEDQCQRIKP